MPAKVNFIIWFACFTTMLAACGVVRPSDSTLTIVPTLTSAPGETSTPTATSTATPALAPTSTNWPLGVEIPFVDATPTSIATPDLDAARYRLRDWDEDAALGLVNVAEQYSYADNVGYFGDDRFNYTNDQVAVRAAALEAIKRYPEAEYKERLEWRVALADAILGRSDSDTWILQQIQDGLNNGHYTLDSLDASFKPYGFEVAVGDIVKNLLGGGQPGQLLFVSVAERPRTSLYAALSIDAQGKYHLMKIHSTWGFNRVSDGPIQIEDHTGDGIPEVVLSQRWWNGSYCGDDYLFFQWQKEAFADLSRGQFSFDGCGMFPGSWNYGPKGANGAKTIEVHEAVGYNSYLIRFKQYKWNGEWYQLAESWVEQPQRLDEESAEWVGLNMNTGNYALLSKELTAFLSTPGGVYSVPSFKDYLRFQLGLAYALQSERSKARSILQEIVEKPANPSIKAVPDAAQIYLQVYNSQDDVYRACRAVLQVMNEAAAGHIYDWRRGEDDQVVAKAWGYKPYSMGYNSTRALCSLDNAFLQLVKSLKPAQFEQTPDRLRELGVLIRSDQQLDLNGDNQPELLLLVDTPGDDAPVEIWILLNSTTKVTALPLVSWERKKYDLPWQNTDEIILEAQVVSAPDGKSVSILKLGTNLFSFQLNPGDTTLQLLYLPGDVESYLTHQKGEQLELEITHTADSPWPAQTRFFHWSTQKTDWIEENDVDRNELFARQKNAETTLLKDEKTDEAVLLLQDILKTQAYDEAYCIYLLGVAYELRGDEQMAIETYFDLWKNHAGTVYARLAREKLERLE